MLVAIAAGVALLLAVVLIARGCGSDEKAPATAAARLVPADALVYVHVSTDRSRDGVNRAVDLARRFPSVPALLNGLIQRFAAGSGQGFSFDRDVKPWLGSEVALALLNTSGDTAGSLIVVDVRDRTKAERFLRRAGSAQSTGSYRGTKIERFHATVTAFVGRFLVIGQEDGVHQAIDDAAGRGPSLQRANAFVRAEKGLPAGRFGDVYASREGVRRLLAPQSGALGAAGVLLDQPALAGSALGLSATGKGLRVKVHSVLDEQLAKRQKQAPQFEPELVGSVPKGAMAYLAVTHLDRSAARLLAAGAAGTSVGQRLTALLGRARSDLAKRAGVNLDQDVLPLFQGETALWLAPAVPAPTLTLISRTRDENGTRLAFSKLQTPLAKLFAPSASGPGQAPTFEQQDVSGTPAFRLRLAPGVELDYAVFDGKLVISTSLSGIAAVKRAKGSIADAGAFKATLGDRPKKVSSLVFLDFSQLLKLGEQTGLTDSQSYLAIREDLSHIKALGAATTSRKTESTAELSVQIP